ncbi:restriction endonuclease [Vibrio sp. SCSIO 43153]|uniref:restriction endonuclease n=1 Tax=Vibrio sp. SCSIO 43153 TaxID=2819098 RepID=UPI0020757128|nr:restriction endonuclease [Vibrio sp. SCSIO 43153]USD52379.1 restriction endonuclease [Vibrio sp. SCSIO 43153]
MKTEVDGPMCPLLKKNSILDLLRSYGMTYDISNRSQIKAKFPCCYQWRVIFERCEDKYGLFIIHKSGKGHKYTDFNELVAITLSAMLNLEGICTVRHIGELGFCSDTEIDEMILLIMQPHFQHFDLEDTEHLKLIERILSALYYIHEFFYDIFDATSDEQISKPVYGIEKDDSWVNDLTHLYDTDRVSIISRSQPNSTYLRFFDPEVLICKFPKLCSFLKKIATVFEYTPKRLQGVGASVILNNNLQNTVPQEVCSEFENIISILGDDSEVYSIAQENHILFFTDLYIACFYCDSSLNSFYEQKRKISERQKLENSLLLFDRNFNWKIENRIDSKRFEELTLELFRREPYIKSAKLACSTNEPDDGRDIIIEYYEDYFKNFTKKNYKRKVSKGIVQCKSKLKASKKQSVGWSEVNDIYHVFTLHRPQAYFLVVNTQITNQLTQTLESIKDNDMYGIKLIDWWCKSDIENRLRDNPEILARFKDVIEYEE